MTRTDYTAITELPTSLLTPEQVRRFAHRYGEARALAQGKCVLEVACGAGGALNYLAQDAAQVVGVDTTSSVLHAARQVTQVPLVQADAQQLPFVAAHFDLILCFEAIYYLEDYRRFLRECYRLLRPDGKALICESNPDWPNFVPGALTTRYLSVPDLAATLAQLGFTQIAAYGILPITATGARQRVINRARRWVMQSGVAALLGPLKTQLQRLSYGELHPLPASVDNAWVGAWQGNLQRVPIPTNQPDRVHRVVYVEATR